jgi:cysteine desulfurase / selenocysteine lyase
MSTSEPALVRVPIPRWTARLGIAGSAGIAPGILSPAELARMANEMFNALPDEAQQPAITAAGVVLPANSAFSGNPYAAVPSPTAPAFLGFLPGLRSCSLNGFVATPDRSVPPDVRSSASAPAAPVSSRAGLALRRRSRPIRPLDSSPMRVRSLFRLPLSLRLKTLPLLRSAALCPAKRASRPFHPRCSRMFRNRQLAGTPQPPAPAVPGAFGVVDSSAIPAFSFLEDARPLFSNPATLPGPVPADAASSVGNPFATPLDQNAPQLPGTVAHAWGLCPISARRRLTMAQVQPRRSTHLTAFPSWRPLAAARVAPGSRPLFLCVRCGAIRRDFPILREVVNGRPLIWLDNGATTQKPQSVIDRISYFYEHENSNVHRAAHELAARATDAYESAREKTRRFLNAGAPREIVFVRGATEAINLVAQSWGRRNIQKDDEIVITWLEHHANIVPWQMLCAEKGARLRVAPVDDSGQVFWTSTKSCWDRRRVWSPSRMSRTLWAPWFP